MKSTGHQLHGSFPTVLIQAADAVRVLGIGRNEYIAMLNQCKGRRLMWRMNPKGLARELLPTQPCRPLMQPWWLVSVANIG